MDHTFSTMRVILVSEQFSPPTILIVADGFIGCMIIFARLSDVFGRKPMILAVLIISSIFSEAHGAT